MSSTIRVQVPLIPSQRRKTLLVEIQKRQKVGGITDRRLREDDPTMTPEEKALERFMKEKQKKGKKSAIFDLEDSEEEEDLGGLTHLGRPLSIAKGDPRDDFKEPISEEDETDREGADRGSKRMRLSKDYAEQLDRDNEAEVRLERLKTRDEVLKEVIAKSKLHKYERRKKKEDDDHLRAELDGGLADVFALLRGRPPKSEAKPSFEPTMNPDRAALLNGKGREEADKEYDERLRQMQFDVRARPSTRTKSEAEKAEEEAKKLKDLEEQRLRRMEGNDSDGDEDIRPGEGDDDFVDDGFDAFGNHTGMDVADQELMGRSEIEDTGSLKSSPLVTSIQKQLGVEDEDDFILDSNLIATESDPEPAESEDSNVDTDGKETDEEEWEFEEDPSVGEAIGMSLGGQNGEHSHKNNVSTPLPASFSCPQSLPDFLRIVQNVATIEMVPKVIQIIRASHDPQLANGNKEKLETLSAVLVEYISYPLNRESRPSFKVVEQLIRHVHSLAKSFPTKTSEAFRNHLGTIQKERPLALNPGDLVLLTGLGTIFPTSDHYHQVTGPAMLSMTRYLEHAIPKTVADLAKGTYLATLCLRYQRLSKRYIPEVVNYILNAIQALSPQPSQKPFGLNPIRDNPEVLRIGYFGEATDAKRKSNFWDIVLNQNHADVESVKLSILKTNLSLIAIIMDLWIGKTAYQEIIAPFLVAIEHLQAKKCRTKLPAALNESIHNLYQQLSASLSQAARNRRPLALHNHRPLPIKSSIPKFEVDYHPEKYYDVDRERAESGKLKAEHKRERKGALRELRKDSRFIAREELREKKEKDEAYEKKYRRLIAEIQGQEGKEAKEYEREKRARKGKR